MTLLLSNEEVDSLLQMPIAWRDGARAIATPRRQCGALRDPHPTARHDALYSLMNMNGVVPELGVAAVRINSDILTWPASPDGQKRVKVPAAPNQRYVGLVLLFSTTTGEPLAIYPDSVVQRMRTGATSGLAAKYLARPDARTVALLGTGWQAGSQAMAICAARPIERIACYSPREASRRAFAAEMSAALGIAVTAAASAREAVRGADVVLCATNSMQPMCRSTGSSPACM